MEINIIKFNTLTMEEKIVKDGTKIILFAGYQCDWCYHWSLVNYERCTYVQVPL